MATGTTAKIHRWSQAVGNVFLFFEILLPTLKISSSLAVSPSSGPPAPAVPPRTPGSRATGDESTRGQISLRKTNRPTTSNAKSSTMATFFMISYYLETGVPDLEHIPDPISCLFTTAKLDPH